MVRFGYTDAVGDNLATLALADQLVLRKGIKTTLLDSSSDPLHIVQRAIRKAHWPLSSEAIFVVRRCAKTAG